MISCVCIVLRHERDAVATYRPRQAFRKIPAHIIPAMFVLSGRVINNIAHIIVTKYLSLYKDARH